MLRFAKLLALLAFSVALAGCVTVENQPFNKEAHAKIKTIAILPAPAVPDYSINILHHPGASFGLIGGPSPPPSSAARAASSRRP